MITLTKAIHQLYEVFATYPFNANMHSCPCCVYSEDKARLVSKPLRQLEEDDLSKYAFKALSTWGEAEDFKHFLPRIFELMGTTDFVVDTFVVLGKLDMCDWLKWETTERNAILDFLKAWQIHHVHHKPTFYGSILTEPFPYLQEINTLLKHWTLSYDNNSICVFIDFVQYDFNDLIDGRGEYKVIPPEERIQLVKWAIQQIPSLEAAFFYFEPIDIEQATAISTTISILEMMSID